MGEGKKVSPVVLKETVRIGIFSYVGIGILLLVYYILATFCPPEVWDVPFDYTVVLGAVCCGIIDILNFFFMGLAVQKVTEMRAAVQAPPQTPSSSSEIEDTGREDEEEEPAVYIDEETEKKARKVMSASFKMRMLMIVVWIALACCLPCFNVVSGIVPLLFPSIGIKLLTIWRRIFSRGRDAE